MFEIGIYVALGVVILGVIYKKYFSRAEWEKRIPHPPTLPFLGNSLALAGPSEDVLRVLNQWNQEYGNRYLVQLGITNRVVIAGCKDAEKILSSSVHIDKSQDYKWLHPWLGTGLLTSNGKKWFQRRKMLTPTFHFRILDDFLDVFNEKAAVFTKILKREFGDGKSFDIFPYVTRSALDIICETAMGKNINAQEKKDSEYVRAIYRISELVQHRQLRPWLYSNFIWSLSSVGREEKALLRILHGFTEKVILEKKNLLKEKRKATKETNNANADEDSFTKGKVRLAFLDLLLEAQANSEGSNGTKNEYLTDLDIREETDTFMFEGHDTTAANINWTIYLLGTYTEHQKKVLEELDSIFGNNTERPITNQDLVQMKYLEYCIKESLRLYPSVPFIARQLGADLKLDDDVTLPKDTTTFVMPYQIHREKGVYTDPDEFIPERFTPSNSQGRHPYAYVPFSAGPRNCIGQKFAMMEEKVVLAHFFRNFSVVSLQKREELKILAELILRPQNGIQVKLTVRN